MEFDADDYHNCSLAIADQEQEFSLVLALSRLQDLILC